MSDEIREQLSALLDDELDKLERPLLLGRLQREARLRECMGRYQLIGEVMRGSGQVETLGVADRVQAALAADPAMDAGNSLQSAGSRWWKPVAGFAIAASVALVAVLSVTSMQDSGTTATPVLASAETATAPTTATSVARVSDGDWNRIEPEIDQRLSGYLVNHNEYASSRGVQGVLPYVRIVGYQNEQ